nr:hypothetical protein [Tanacetum cinerariifolium]
MEKRLPGLAGEVFASTKKKGRTVAITAEDMQKRKNDVKARTTLLLALPDEHQLRLSKYDYAKEFWEAILKTFGGNETTKKTKKNQLKPPYGNFKAEGSETLKQTLIGYRLFMRADRFWKKTGKKITIQGSDVAGFDKSKVECFNCHKMGHFVRECRSPRSQDRGKRESYKKDPKVEEYAPKAMIAIDGKTQKTTKISKLNEELSDCETDLYNYKRGLSQVKARLVKFKENEIKYCEKIRVLERDIELKDNKIEYLRNELEKVKNEKESIDFKIENFKNASKDLDRRLESQKLDKDKKNVGFNEHCVVPPPPAQVYSPPKKDLSWMGLPEFVDDTVTNYTRPTPSIDVSTSVSNELEERWKSNNPYFFEQRGSSSNVVSKPMIKIVKESGCPNATKVNNTENVRKPRVKYAKIFDHLEFNRKHDIWVDKGKTWSRINHAQDNMKYTSTHKSMTPRAVLLKAGTKPIVINRPFSTARPTLNSAQPKMTSFVKTTHSNVKRPFERKSAAKNKVWVPTIRPRIPTVGSKVLTAKPTVAADKGNKGKTGIPQDNIADKGYWNSGCSRSNLVKGLPSKSFENDHFCVACLKEKQHKASFLIINGIALPNWFHEAQMATSNDATKKDDAIPNNNAPQKEQDEVNRDKEVYESSGNSNPSASTKVSSNDSFELASSSTVETEVPTISTPVPTGNLSVPLVNSSVPIIISRGVSSHLEPLSLGNAMSFENRLEDFFRDTSDVISLNDVEADLSNMETAIQINPTPTLRIHKDHPKSQIISPVDTPYCLFSCFLSQEEPKKIVDALKDASYVEAMQQELLQFKIQNVWVLVDCPNRVRPIRTKWVLKNKKDKRGIIIRNKAQLVTQGHTQEEGIDYKEVFAPVARIEAIRLFLAYASYMGFTVYQMDVKSAFLYGTNNEEVYVMQPPGFQDPEFPHRVYKVEKAVYGLHQAPKAWKHKGEFLLVQVYVDDIIFGSSNLKLCREFEALMHEKFQMSDMGELNFFLGLQVLQKKDGIFLSQDKYVGDILKKFGYTDIRSTKTLMDRENPWGKDGFGKYVELYLYRSMIGSLMYLTASRPDIMFVVCACARHQVTPIKCHLHAVKRIFRYLKGHPKLGLWYPKESPFDLVAYLDSNYGGANKDRKSTTRGYDNVADLLTKAFNVGRFQYLVGGDSGNSVNGLNMDPVVNTRLNFLHGSDSEQWTHEFIYRVSASVYVWIGTVELFASMLVPQGEGRITRGTIRISQSKVPSPGADETAFLTGDVRYEEAFPTDTSLDAGQDRENISKSSAMPHEASPRVTSLGGGEDRDTVKNSGKSADKESDNTDEMANVLGTLGAANILACGGLRLVFTTASLSVATASTVVSPAVATASGSFLTADKGKGKMTELEQPSKEKVLEQMSVQLARDLEAKKLEMMIAELDRSNKMVAKYLSEYEQTEAGLSHNEKLESERRKRPGIQLGRESFKKLKTTEASGTKPSQEHQFKEPKEPSEEELKKMIKLVPVEELYIEALQVKYPIID